MHIRTIAVFVLFASAASMPGQTFGEITGETQDASGGGVASAASFPSLPPGIYDLRVTAPVRRSG